MKTRSEIVLDCIDRAARRVDDELDTWPDTPEELGKIMGWSDGYADRVYRSARKQRLVGEPVRCLVTTQRMAASAIVLRDEYGWSWQRIADTLGYSSREAASMSVLRLRRRRERDAG